MNKARTLMDMCNDDEQLLELQKLINVKSLVYKFGGDDKVGYDKKV